VIFSYPQYSLSTFHSNLSSFRTLTNEISPFPFNALTDLRNLSIHMNLSSHNKVTCLRISSINVHYLIRNLTYLCALRTATCHFPTETGTLYVTWLYICPFSLSNVTSLRPYLKISSYTHTHTLPHTPKPYCRPRQGYLFTVPQLQLPHGVTNHSHTSQALYTRQTQNTHT